MKKVLYSFLFAVVSLGVENFMNYSISSSQGEILFELTIYHAIVVFLVAFASYYLAERSKKEE